MESLELSLLRRDALREALRQASMDRHYLSHEAQHGPWATCTDAECVADRELVEGSK